MPQRMPGFSTQSIVFMERIFKALNIYLRKSDHLPSSAAHPAPGFMHQWDQAWMTPFTIPIPHLCR